jgi:hypothetical protein
MTDNELIAEFMGVSRHRTEPHLFWCQPYNCFTSLDNLAYHSSWDWLMPVVERIAKAGYDVELYASGLNENHECHIHDTGNSYACIEDSYSMLNATYKAVVEFIKWYNTKQQERKHKA